MNEDINEKEWESGFSLHRNHLISYRQVGASGKYDAQKPLCKACLRETEIGKKFKIKERIREGPNVLHIQRRIFI